MGKTPIIFVGHGGMINGVYQTAGKRSPKGSKGVLYEGMFNRWVAFRLIEKLDRFKIKYYHGNPEYRDVNLNTKVKRANTIYNKNKNVYLLSIHANAGGGIGIEGFTTKGVTKSDKIAELFLSNIEKDFLGKQRMRFDMSDGDRDKEVNYYILKKARCPAFLLECGFMDNKKDYNNLWDEKYIEVLVNSLVKSIKELYYE